MKINVQVINSDNLLEAKLSSKKISDGTLWRGFVDGHDDDDYCISIRTDEKNQIGESKKGNKILSSIYDINKEFSMKFEELLDQKLENEKSGIEAIDEDSEVISEPKPYDPELIRVDTKPMSIRYVLEMMNSEHNDLDLSPDFQRNFVWTDITRKSRLIESILLRIPLPVFYLSQDNDGKLQIVDGVQRLTVIKYFLSNEFKLKNVEYLDDCEGCYFDKKGSKNLDPKYIRRIYQTQLIFNIIDPQTPHKVKFEIFKRINTGGKPLNNQEIRNCLANPQVRSWVKKLSSSEEFIKATSGSVSSNRMADEELVMRFVGFYYIKILDDEKVKYKGGMKQFLDDTLELLNNEEDEEKLNMIRIAFLNSMKIAEYLFGEFAFRKCKCEHIKPSAKKQLINKSIFTSLSVLLSNYDYNEVKKKNEKMCFLIPFALELEKNQDFYNSITIGTNDQKRIEQTFSTIQNIITNNLKV
jgi:hypothetical protein